MGSRKNLLGDAPDAKLLASLCNERQVTEKTPPTFLFHTDADRGVVAQRRITYFGRACSGGQVAVGGGQGGS